MIDFYIYWLTELLELMYFLDISYGNPDKYILSFSVFFLTFSDRSKSSTN